MRRLALMLASLTLASGVLATASTAQASVTFYSSKSAFDAASTTSLLEDFSGAPDKGVLLSTLTLHGVTYTPLAGEPFANLAVALPGLTNFGAAVGTTTENILTANGDEDIVAAFSNPYTAVGFNAFFNGLGDGTLTVFGAGSSVLDSYTFSGGLDPATGLANRGYLGFTSTSNITGFEWKTTNGRTLNTGFTNISVGDADKRDTDGVPEPAAWSLMIMGFAAAGASLRRARRAALA